MKLAWVTDPHLDWLSRKDIQSFLLEITSFSPDALLITGDIALGDCIEQYLRTISFQVPLYFVLGNHDYWAGQIDKVRARVAEMSCDILVHSRVYLHRAGIIPLTSTTALVGVDGWGDARYGDYENSGLVLGDDIHCADIKHLGKEAKRLKLNALGDESAARLQELVPQALDQFSHLIVATHVPPWREAALYQGVPSDKHSLPFFSCKATGDVLLAQAGAHPDRQITVLCGHTHDPARIQVRPNLLCRVGAATYGHPRIEDILEL